MATVLAAALPATAIVRDVTAQTAEPPLVGPAGTVVGLNSNDMSKFGAARIFSDLYPLVEDFGHVLKGNSYALRTFASGCGAMKLMGFVYGDGSGTKGKKFIKKGSDDVTLTIKAPFSGQLVVASFVAQAGTFCIGFVSKTLLG